MPKPKTGSPEWLALYYGRCDRGEMPDGTLRDGLRPMTDDERRRLMEGKGSTLRWFVFVDELDADTSMESQSQTVMGYATIRGQLDVVDVGTELQHKQSYYRALTELLEQRNLRDRKTSLSFVRPDVKTEIHKQLEYQHAEGLWQRFVDAAKAAYDLLNRP